MAIYQIAGRTAATAATAGNASAQLWNPHSTICLVVEEIGFFATTAPTAGSSITLRRGTARGTASTTNTPAIQQNVERTIAPPSGALLDLAFSGQPTLETGAFLDYVLSAVAASGMIYPCRIVVPPGAGLVVAVGAAIIVPISTVWFRWAE